MSRKKNNYRKAGVNEPAAGCMLGNGQKMIEMMRTCCAERVPGCTDRTGGKGDQESPGPGTAKTGATGR